MRKITLLLALYILGISSASALNVGDITTFIYSGNKFVSKEVKNTTNVGRLVNIKVEKINSPLENGKVIPMERPDEILLTPASLLMPANSSDVIRFFYKGPDDGIERYYRIVWFDQALSDAQEAASPRNAVATASARIGTLLVVAPGKARYDYEYANGTIKNTGNATLRVVAYGTCLQAKEGEDCKENYYLLPGYARTLARVNVADKKGHLAVWQAEKFIPVK
ncbi:hypothetical protein [Erwinia sp. HR93]|uniref:EcpB family pilus assembly chaperone n=1 Tax=Erwinia sp. HR93 TaxID=3094840 RepID=UPI002ADEC82C|nr:hypothetical protein [Erwinia sp. HR93]MEA1064141.1 hypothetical protein [Erwinia sp. HR93]